MGERLSSSPEIDAATGLPIGIQVVGPEARWPASIALPGRTVNLVPLDPDLHGEKLWQAVGGAHNAALWLYMSDGPFIQRPDFDAALSSMAARTDTSFFCILNAPAGQPVGWCAFLNIQPKNRSIEIGSLMFSPALQHTPAATEALYLMAKYAFDELGYRRYEWKCNGLNAKSRRAAERFGFVFEGIFRQHMIIKGRTRDSAWFSITSDEWPGVKSALENWLSPANFDPNGQQLQKLGQHRVSASE